ncbi:MAG: LAGLIDADG family homing endonuclease [Patescibacteria group bacterium]
MGSTPTSGTTTKNLKTLAYIIGIALGDGNLSNPNKRAVRLRVTCDTQYQNIINNICNAIHELLPLNKVSIIHRAKTYIDISCYSNKWEELLGWKASGGSKYVQKVSIPKWIKEDHNYIIPCLKGLIETDGSIYYDRSYKMVNFVTIIPQLAKDVLEMITKLGFQPYLYKKIETTKKSKYTIRISKNVEEFIAKIGIEKIIQ